MSEHTQETTHVQTQQIDQGVMDTLRSRDNSLLAQQIDPLSCTHNEKSLLTGWPSECSV